MEGVWQTNSCQLQIKTLCCTRIEQFSTLQTHSKLNVHSIFYDVRLYLLLENTHTQSQPVVIMYATGFLFYGNPIFAWKVAQTFLFVQELLPPKIDTNWYPRKIKVLPQLIL